MVVIETNKQTRKNTEDVSGSKDDIVTRTAVDIT